MVRWGVLGAGSVARRRVMPAMADNSRSSLQALMVRDLERAKKLAREFGAEKAYACVADLLADAEVDAVYVSSPVNLHCEHVLAAAAAGKHVLCEKPMALSPDECRSMMAACDDVGVHLEVCFVLRGWPVYHQVKRIIDEGRLGQLVELRAHLAKWTPRSPDEWRLDPAQSGGGAFVDVGSHYLDLFRFLAGDFARISYMDSSGIHGWPVEESGFALLEFRSGAKGVLSVSCTVPHSGHVLEVFGTEGTLLLGRDMRIITGDGEEAHPMSFPDYYSGLLKHFCRCVEEGGQPLASGLDGLRNIEVIDAAYRAGRQSQVIEVPGD
ncbi:Gfo/Idh/MocA family protein [Candidatus Latescibacterota bacterium]